MAVGPDWLLYGGIILAVLILAAAIFYGYRRYNQRREDSVDDDGVDRVTSGDRDPRTISARAKVKSMRTEGKLALVSVVILLAGGVFVAYRYLKIGHAPAWIDSKHFLVAMASGVTAPVAAKWGWDKRDDFETFVALNEPEHGAGTPEPNVVPFHPDDVEADGDQRVIREYLLNGPFGVLARPKRVAESTRLRSDASVPAVDEEKVGWEMPDGTVEVVDGVHVKRTSSITLKRTPGRKAHFTLDPPKRKSREEYRRVTERARELEYRIDEIIAEAARKDETLEKLEKQLEQERDSNEKRLLQMLAIAQRFTGATQVTHQDLAEEDTLGRSSRSDDEDLAETLNELTDGDIDIRS